MRVDEMAQKAGIKRKPESDDQIWDLSALWDKRRQGNQQREKTKEKKTKKKSTIICCAVKI